MSSSTQGLAGWLAATALAGGPGCGDAAANRPPPEAAQTPVVVVAPAAGATDLHSAYLETESPDEEDAAVEPADQPPEPADEVITPTPPPAPPTASASVKRDALNAYKEARKAFASSDYTRALEHFRKADSLYPGASPKHQIAVCLDKLGRRKEAVAAYQAFIDSKPSPKYQQRVDDARKRIRQLTGRP